MRDHPESAAGDSPPPGLATRLGEAWDGLKTRLGGAEPATDPALPQGHRGATPPGRFEPPMPSGRPAAAAGLHPQLQPYAGKLCTAAQAVALVQPGDHVFVGSACATPRALVAALEAQEFGPGRRRTGALPHRGRGARTTPRAAEHALPTPQLLRRQRHAAGGRKAMADYVPLRSHACPTSWPGRIDVDVALIQVSLPDEFGYVSLGVSGGRDPGRGGARAPGARRGQPGTCRAADGRLDSLHVDALHRLVLVDTPVIEHRHAAMESAAMEQIARYIGGIIEDGSTLQIGLGRITNEALHYLADRQDLGIHSDVITDAIIPLLEKGILTGRRKTHQPGKIVTSFAMGRGGCTT
jgi:acyl-CoA hydrolase